MIRRNLLLLFVLVFAIAIFLPASEAQSGCCSYHNGVDCAAGMQANEHVICKDGWLNSTCLYSEMSMCKNHTAAPSPENSSPAKNETAYCGDKMCNAEEDSSICPADCGSVKNETQQSCPSKYECPDGTLVDWCESISSVSSSGSGGGGSGCGCKENPASQCVAAQPENKTIVCSTGCERDEKCLSYGTRIGGENASSSYCDISSGWKLQKHTREPCLNSYECETNFCSKDVCVDIEKEVKETKGLLQRLLDWLEHLFGKRE